MLRDIKVAHRLGLGFAVMVLIILIMAGISALQMKSMYVAEEEIAENWMPSVTALGEVQQAFLETRIGVANFAALRSTEDFALERTRFEEFYAHLKKALTSYEKLISSSEEQALYQRFRQSLAVYEEGAQKVLQLASKGSYAEASEFRKGLWSAVTSSAKSLEELIALNQAGAAAASGHAKGSYDTALGAVGLGVFIAVIVAIAIALFITRSIVQPLGEAVGVARRIASGDLTQSVRVEGNDEPAHLLGALRDMQGSLREILEHITRSSAQLTSASEELSTVSENTSRSLSQQHHELEQAATAVNEMTATVEEVARNAVGTSEASKQSDSTARTGRDQVRKAIDSIDGLADDMNRAADQVGHLADNVRDISKVLDVIRAIAEQTNLLALNAAIEAARAGDAGRGFAVVADEVRALAHRTQQSTQEIEQMIATIQNGTNQAVSAMQSSNSMARVTLEVAEKAGQALEEITNVIGTINERTLLIATASEEQAHVAKEVDRNLINIRDLSEHSASGASQTMTACQELTRLAVELNDRIVRFRI